MLHLSGEMERVSKLFTENQICSLFLKGPVVAYDLYGDISLRTSKDLDILIPETDLAKAENLLLNEGYEKEEVPTVLNEIKWRHHHIAYFHPKKKIQIEIHWRLHPRPMKEPKFEELWARKRISSLTKHPVSFLGREDLVLYLIAHGARHGWFRLRSLKDIDQMFKHEMDYKKVSLFIKEYQHQRLVGQASILVNQLLNKSKKICVANERHSKKLSEQAYLYIRNGEEFEYPNKYLFSLKTNIQKIHFLVLLFYPRPVDVELITLLKCIHFLYFPLRPFLWTWRKIIKFTT